MEGELTYRLTPKGVVAAVATKHDARNGTEFAEQLLERLYVHAACQLTDRRGIPAIAFIDGYWEFVTIRSSDDD